MEKRAIALATAAAFLLSACGSEEQTSPRMFAGTWDGHTRRLVIRDDGQGHELISSGCCTPVVTARFRLVNVHGTPERAAATIRFTSVRVDKEIFAESHHAPPRAGQETTLRLMHGVITDEATTGTFCAAGVLKCGL